MTSEDMRAIAAHLLTLAGTPLGGQVEVPSPNDCARWAAMLEEAADLLDIANAQARRHHVRPLEDQAPTPGTTTTHRAIIPPGRPPA